MLNFSNNSIKKQYQAELGKLAHDYIDRCTCYIVLADMLEVPTDVLDKLEDCAHSLTLVEQQYILEQSSIEGIFNLDLFNSKFPVGPYVEVYPAEYATKAVYKYILINPLRSNHD